MSRGCHSNRGTVYREGEGRSTPTERRCPPAIETINRRNQSQRPQRPTDRQTCPHSLKGRPPGKGTDGHGRERRRKGADCREGRKVCCGLMTWTGGMAFMKGVSRVAGMMFPLSFAWLPRLCECTDAFRSETEDATHTVNHFHAKPLHFLFHIGMIKQTR